VSGAVQTPVVADWVLAAFEGLSAQGPRTLQALRQAGLDRFAALGFPTTRDEDWHYTSVAPIAEQEFQVPSARSGNVTAEQVAPFCFGGSDWHTAVFVNGRYEAGLSSMGALPDGVSFATLADAPEGALPPLGSIASHESMAFTALNTAFLRDGAVLRVAADTVVEKPIHVVWVTDATAARAMLSPRLFITVERHASATVLESYVGLSDAVYFTNAVAEASVGEGARLRHYRIQREGMRSFHVGTAVAEQARASEYTSFSFVTGAELSRVNVYTTMNGEGSGTTLNGLYLLDGTQHCDHQTYVGHVQPHCFSRELYKGILDGQSHGVFNGKVFVDPIAQKTDGKQTNNTLLLSRTARIDTKPQLEIFADDVRCTHGATIGQIDQTALFYMKSRGLDHRTARRLLTYAFAADALETIELEAVRDELELQTLARYMNQDA
jgi:Fe-S cluster assembly protein SufD